MRENTDQNNSKYEHLSDNVRVYTLYPSLQYVTYLQIFYSYMKFDVWKILQLFRIFPQLYNNTFGYYKFWFVKTLKIT